MAIQYFKIFICLSLIVAGILSKGYSDDRYQIQWKKIHDVSDSSVFPSRRGGHQLALDSVRRRIYLFGGWNGQLDLSDFWYFDMDSSRWNQISVDTYKEVSF